MATTFPDSMQEISDFMDIEQTDLNAYNQYIECIKNGDFSNAQTILQTISNFDKKVITANKLNQIVDTLNALQDLYSGDTWQNLVTEKQTTWLSFINQFSFKGTWNKSSISQYKQNSMVSYTSTASGDDPILYLYIARVDITTTDTPYKNWQNYLSSGNLSDCQWVRFTIQGTRGESGENMTYVYDWDSTTNYKINDVVMYDNKWWSCVTANINQTPSTTSTYWNFEFDGSPVQIPVQTATPTEQTTGDLWFEIVE